LIGEDVGETHRQALELQLNILGRQLAKHDPRDTLNSLADIGFAWRDVARLVGVSVPAVRRWRQGEPPTGPHLFAIGRLAAFIEILNRDHMVTNPVPWLEMPLSDEVPLTGIDVAAAGHYEELIDLAADHMGPEDLLTRLNPNWREDMRSDVEVFRAEDGELGLRSRMQENR
jgi:hypothetical protein